MTEEQLMSIGTKEKFKDVMDLLLLTDKQAQIFKLKYGRGLLNTQIAGILGVSRKYVGEQLRIIRNKMAQLEVK